jgi:hypothetical protein
MTTGTGTGIQGMTTVTGTATQVTATGTTITTPGHLTKCCRKST